jgi:hypothetical protein
MLLGRIARLQKQMGCSMKQRFGSYMLEFQAEPSPFRNREVRYHWLICRARNPEQLLSWGHASTQQLAEIAAFCEMEALDSGLTQGGRVVNTSKVAIHRY